MGAALGLPSRGERLYAAAREGDLGQVEKCITENPALANGPRAISKGNFPLHVAATHGQINVLSLLLARGARPDVCNHSSQTPLMLASKSGRWACVSALLEAGANMLCFDLKHRRTCLHFAARGGHTECVRRILTAAQGGSIAGSWGFARFVNVRDANGATPLHLAARAGHAGTMQALLEQGALVSSCTSAANGASTPLHWAARGGSRECVRELIAWGASRDARDCNGCTPYVFALKSGHDAVAALLNPQTAEPLVWPSPWKFVAKLNASARALLEQALTEAQLTQTGSVKTLTGKEALGKDGEITQVEEESDAQAESSDKDDADVCSICFERPCNIEVRECGHRMCAMCTLALCCHCKPSAASPHAPPPACPFCRTEIKQLEALTPVHEKPEPARPPTPVTAAKGKSKVHNASWGRW